MRVVDLDLDAVKRGLDEGSMTLVDVREPHEFEAGAIPGSLSHPLSSFDPERLRGLPGRIVFSCRTGVRSIRAIEWAQTAGFDLNEHYLGGFQEWSTMGEPVA